MVTDCPLRIVFFQGLPSKSTPGHGFWRSGTHGPTLAPSAVWFFGFGPVSAAVFQETQKTRKRIARGEAQSKPLLET